MTVFCPKPRVSGFLQNIVHIWAGSWCHESAKFPVDRKMYSSRCSTKHPADGRRRGWSISERALRSLVARFPVTLPPSSRITGPLCAARMNPREHTLFAAMVLECASKADPDAILAALGADSMAALAIVEPRDFVQVAGLEIVPAMQLSSRIHNAEKVLPVSSTVGSIPALPTVLTPILEPTLYASHAPQSAADTALSPALSLPTALTHTIDRGIPIQSQARKGWRVCHKGDLSTCG